MQPNTTKNEAIRFVLSFFILFIIFYYFNILFFGITTPGNHYLPFLSKHLNYIHWLRQGLLHTSAQILTMSGYTAITNEYELLVAGHGRIQLVYSCLGLGVISFFAAFVLSYPGILRSKLVFLFSGIIVIELLNVFRFVVLALTWTKKDGRVLDHHTIFNIFIYLVIAVAIYFWVTRKPELKNKI